MADDHPSPPNGHRRPPPGRVVKKGRTPPSQRRPDYPVARLYAPPPDYPVGRLVAPPPSTPAAPQPAVTTPLVAAPPVRKTTRGPGLFSGSLVLGLVVLAALCTAIGWMIGHPPRETPKNPNSLARTKAAAPTAPEAARTPKPEARPAEASVSSAPRPDAPVPVRPTAPKAVPPRDPVKPPPPKASPSIAVNFERDVLPILRTKCFACHGAEKKKGGLDVRTMASLLKGGKSGPVVTLGSLEQSPLWDAVDTNRMPPGPKKLSPAEKQVIQNWLVNNPGGKR